MFVLGRERWTTANSAEEFETFCETEYLHLVVLVLDFKLFATRRGVLA